MVPSGDIEKHSGERFNAPSKGVSTCIAASGESFSASNGWLNSFITRHSIVVQLMCGEREGVSEVDIANWAERLPSLMKGCSPAYMFNMGGIGFIFKALPD